MEQRVGAYFGSRVFDIVGVQQLDLNDLISDLSQQAVSYTHLTLPTIYSV